MTKIEPEVAQALVSLRGNPSFSSVLNWIERSVEKDKNTCVDAEGVTLHRAQGSAKTLREILDAFAEAPLVLQKISQQQKPPVGR